MINKERSNMKELTRRQFLAFLGGGTAVVACGAIAPYWSVAATGGFNLPFTPVRLPHPLPIYTTNKNFLGAAIGSGSVLDPDSRPELARYTVLDDVVVPPEFERYVILAWGDRIFPNSNDYVGYNHDYTGYVPLAGENEGLLWVNHEYVSYPFSEIAPETPTGLVGNSFEAVIGFPLPKDSAGVPVKNREFLGECLYNVGGTVARIIRDRPFGQFQVVLGDERNRRIHGLSGLAINARRADAYSKVTAWGARPHQTGDEKYLIGTGPAANEVFERVNADGLANRIIGTAFNCSGDTTRWGTFISTEENFQGSSLFFVGVTEDVRPDGSQTDYIAGTTGAEFGLIGEKYGWILEIDPRDPRSRAKKHTALGRFRHENVAMRVVAGEPLVVYSGDDRRGGHVWKFVSNGAVHDRNAPNNSKLLEDGTLFVARFNPDGTGLWIPLVLATPTHPNVPSEIGSVQKAKEGMIDRNGLVKLPRRNGIAGQTVDGGAFNVDTTNEATVLPAYRGKTLADFYGSQGAILVCVPRR
jgi:secreted PhoX family phosphatase